MVAGNDQEQLLLLSELHTCIAGIFLCQLGDYKQAQQLLVRVRVVKEAAYGRDQAEVARTFHSPVNVEFNRLRQYNNLSATVQ